MNTALKTATRILLGFLLIHALMNGVIAAIYTASVQEGKSGIIDQQWDKLKNSLFGLTP